MTHISTTVLAQCCKDYQNGSSIPEIAERFSLSRSTIRRRLIKAGVKMRTLTESIALAAHKIGAKTRGIKRAPFTKEHRRKISLARRRLYKNKQGGRTLKKTTGYYVLTRWPNTNKSEHVYLAEKHILKRKLKKNEVVHHINKIRTDNRLENLQVMTRSEHAALHAKENYTKRKKDKYGRFV